MDRERFERGEALRRRVLGDEYVGRSLTRADDFSRPYQEALTEFCWGFAWADPALDLKTRSLMNLTMIAALGKMDEWRLHCRGAIRNGVTRDELRATIHAIGIYCGAPAALSCFRAAREVLAEVDAEAKAAGPTAKGGTGEKK